MLFTRNAQDPIYNSLSDINSGTPINEWFNLSVYDESTLSQTAQEIESIIKKIPESFFLNRLCILKTSGHLINNVLLAMLMMMHGSDSCLILPVN